jgi:acyl-CoA reductase-like NAD-dependent aldehyde dehydrogenase
MLESAHSARGDWLDTPLSERQRIVADAIDSLEEMNDDIVSELAWQMGRPIRYGGEIGGVRERAEYMIDIAGKALADEVIEDSGDFRRVIAREPLGVVLVVAPWNYPYLTAINAIVPALVAGNAVFLKHASQTLLAGERLEQAFRKAGLPEGLFHNVRLSHDLTAELISGRCFDFVNFTGSVGGGRAMERAAAGTFTGLGLELGGKDPGYVRHDADLQAAVETLVDGAMFNSGQCCCGIERIYVHDSLYDEFCDRAQAIVSEYLLGNPLEPETTLGPMANVRFAELVREHVADAMARGARGIVDPGLFKADQPGTPYIAPQVLVDVDHGMRVMREESFGPVVGVMRVSGDEEAIRLMNDSDFGLTASLWTKDRTAAQTIGRQIQTGTVFMNRCDYLDPALCWTGCKDTGRGISLSRLGYHSLTRVKSYHFRG